MLCHIQCAYSVQHPCNIDIFVGMKIFFIIFFTGTPSVYFCTMWFYVTFATISVNIFLFLSLIISEIVTIDNRHFIKFKRILLKNGCRYHYFHIPILAFQTLLLVQLKIICRVMKKKWFCASLPISYTIWWSLKCCNRKIEIVWLHPIPFSLSIQLNLDTCRYSLSI